MELLKYFIAQIFYDVGLTVSKHILFPFYKELFKWAQFYWIKLAKNETEIYELQTDLKRMNGW